METMEITRTLTRDAIMLNMKPVTKLEWIEQLVGVLCDAWRLPRRDEILRAVLDRESAHSTAIGQGVAVPHGKTSAAPRLMMACGIAPDGVPDYDAPDDEPVRLGFLLVSPKTEAGPHVRALASISRVAISDGALEQLLRTKSPRDLLRTLKRVQQDA